MGTLLGESMKRERWLSLGRFRVPVFTHSVLLAVQRRYCHSRLRDSAIYLMNRGALSIKSELSDDDQVVKNSDPEARR